MVVITRRAGRRLHTLLRNDSWRRLHTLLRNDSYGTQRPPSLADVARPFAWSVRVPTLIGIWRAFEPQTQRVRVIRRMGRRFASLTKGHHHEQERMG